MYLTRLATALAACGGAALLAGLPLCLFFEFDRGVVMSSLVASCVISLLAGVPTFVAAGKERDVRSRDRTIAVGAAISAMIAGVGLPLFLWWCLRQYEHI